MPYGLYFDFVNTSCAFPLSINCFAVQRVSATNFWMILKPTHAPILPGVASERKVQGRFSKYYCVVVMSGV